MSNEAKQYKAFKKLSRDERNCIMYAARERMTIMLQQALAEKVYSSYKKKVLYEEALDYASK